MSDIIFMSLLLNLVNTFLKMIDTYIIVLIADDYSLSLEAATTVCGVVIGSMEVAPFFLWFILVLGQINHTKYLSYSAAVSCLWATLCLRAYMFLHVLTMSFSF